MPLKDRKRRQVIGHRIAVGRIGRRKANGKRGAPTKLDHFEITLAEMDENGDFPVDKAAHAALADYGCDDTGKPKRVPIRLDSDDIDAVLVQEYECRRWDPDKQQMRVWCVGDGETAKRKVKGGGDIPCRATPPEMGGSPERTPRDLLPILDKPWTDRPGTDHRCPFAQNRDPNAGPTCKPKTELVARLEVVGNIGSRSRFRSHAHGTADALRQSLEDIKDTMPGGILQHVPLNLVVRKRQTAIPGMPGKSTWQPVVSAELRVGLDDAIQLVNTQLQARAQLEGQAREVRLLEAARTELATDDEVEAEWFTDAQRPSGAFGDDDGDEDDSDAAGSGAQREDGEAGEGVDPG
jgi:hypothetical protein